MITAQAKGFELIQLKKRLDALVKAGKPLVVAGITEGPVLEYAPIQEFGGTINVTEKMRGFLGAMYGIHLRKTTKTISIPSRPFLRTTWKRNNGKWSEYLARALRAGQSPRMALELVGTMMEDDIRKTLDSNLPPPNSEATTRIKEQEAPTSVGRTLYFKGELYKSITHEVHDK